MWSTRDSVDHVKPFSPRLPFSLCQASLNCYTTNADALRALPSVHLKSCQQLFRPDCIPSPPTQGRNTEQTEGSLSTAKAIYGLNPNENWSGQAFVEHDLVQLQLWHHEMFWDTHSLNKSDGFILYFKATALMNSTLRLFWFKIWPPGREQGKHDACRWLMTTNRGRAKKSLDFPQAQREMASQLPGKGICGYHPTYPDATDKALEKQRLCT